MFKPKKNKAFSIVEVMVASALSLSLGVVVATTLNTATNSMRKSNYRINANSEARTLSTNLNKFISSAEQRSYCVDTNVLGATTNCSYLDKDRTYAPITYFGPGPTGVSYQMEFFTNLCLTTKALCATSSSRVNAAKAIIYVKEDPTDKSKNEIGFCYIPNSLVTLYNKATLNSATVVSGGSCPAGNMVYRSYGLKYSNNIFKLLDDTGTSPSCITSVTPNISTPSQACLSSVKSVRVVLEIPWLNNPKNIAAMGSNKTNIDSFINIKGVN
jgi:hypothetical protein